MINHMDIVHDYLRSYNSFDIDKMISLFTVESVFEDISNSRGISRYYGQEEIRKVALQSKEYFKDRKQTIVNSVIGNDRIALEIEYNATLKLDLPNGLKKGQKLVLRGVSIFEFKNNKIVRLADYS